MPASKTIDFTKFKADSYGVGLYSTEDGRYIAFYPGDNEVILDGSFTVNELEELAKHVKLTHGNQRPDPDKINR